MDFSLIAAAGLCFGVGVLLTFFGGGGGILTVPIFIYVAHYSAQEAISTSLLVIGVASLIASIQYIQKKAVNGRLVLIFLASGSWSTWLGAQATGHFENKALMALFGVLMVLVGVLLFFKAGRDSESNGVVVCRPGILVSSFVGAGVGFLTGFLGVGGGFLIVPAIAVLMRCSMQTAVGTALVIIVFNSFVGLLGHASSFSMRWDVAGLFLFFSILGVLAGRKWIVYVKTSVLQKSFSVLVFLLGVFLITQYWAVS